jgi:cytochrome c5
MKRLISSLAIIAVISLFVVSCYYDNEEALYPSLSNSCDTTNVTYNGTIVSIFSNNCYSCHSNANSAFGGSIVLDSYANVIMYESRITPAIKQTGSKPMPPNGKLKDCSITQWDIWVRNGSLNN